MLLHTIQQPCYDNITEGRKLAVLMGSCMAARALGAGHLRGHSADPTHLGTLTCCAWQKPPEQSLVQSQTGASAVLGMCNHRMSGTPGRSDSHQSCLSSSASQHDAVWFHEALLRVTRCIESCADASHQGHTQGTPACHVILVAACLM